MIHLIARWFPEGLQMFHTQAWNSPEVHASAAADILAGTHTFQFPHMQNYLTCSDSRVQHILSAPVEVR